MLPSATSRGTKKITGDGSGVASAGCGEPSTRRCRRYAMQFHAARPETIGRIFQGILDTFELLREAGAARLASRVVWLARPTQIVNLDTPEMYPITVILQ